MRGILNPLGKILARKTHKKIPCSSPIRSSEVKIVWIHQVAVSRAARIFETLRSRVAISPPPELARSQRVTRHIPHEPARGLFPPIEMAVRNPKMHRP